MASDTLPAALFGLGGILLGGGLQAGREWFARRTEARAIEAALVAEIDAVLTVIETRSLIGFLGQVRAQAQACVASGKGDTPIVFPRVAATWNYFAAYDALLPKIGRLPAQKARALIGFYVAARSSSEMILKRPGTNELPLPAKLVLGHLLTEEVLAQRVVAIGKAIVAGRWHDASGRSSTKVLRYEAAK